MLVKSAMCAQLWVVYCACVHGLSLCITNTLPLSCANVELVMLVILCPPEECYLGSVPWPLQITFLVAISAVCAEL